MAASAAWLPMSTARRRPLSPALASGLVAGLVGVGTFLYLLRFPATLNAADESLYLYGAKRVLQGDAIYHDFFEILTPLSFYFFALVYSLGGTTLVAAKVAMAAVNAVSAVLVFGLARKVAGVALSGTAALFFVAGCLPVLAEVSAHWMSTAAALGTAAVLLSDRLASSHVLRPALTGALAGVALCIQQQRSFFLVVWVGAATLLLSLCESNQGRPLDGSASVSGPAGAAASSSPRSGWLARFWRQVAWEVVGFAAVVSLILGYTAWRASVAEMFDALVVFVITGYGKRVVGSVPWGGAEPLSQGWYVRAFPWMASLIPATIAIEGAALVWRARQCFGRPEAVRACLVLLAAATAASIFYFPDFIHVALIAPFSLIVAAGILERIRSAPLARGKLTAAAASVAWVALLILAAQKAQANLAHVSKGAEQEIPTAFGTVEGPAAWREILTGLREAMGPEPPGGWQIYAYPADTWLYLTLPRRQRHAIHLPPAGLQRGRALRGGPRAHRAGCGGLHSLEPDLRQARRGAAELRRTPLRSRSRCACLLRALPATPGVAGCHAPSGAAGRALTHGSTRFIMKPQMRRSVPRDRFLP